MKITNFSIFLIVLLIIVIFLSVSMSCSTFKPFSPEMMYNGKYPYNEGFRSNTAYSTYPENQTVDALGDKFLIPQNNENSCMKVNGFNGLVCSPDTVQNPDDIYSTAKGSLDCKSYGYTNSQGFLCMDDYQVKLLTTRGGNATGN
jgi:hypothetical protein